MMLKVKINLLALSVGLSLSAQYICSCSASENNGSGPTNESNSSSQVKAPSLEALLKDIENFFEKPVRTADYKAMIQEADAAFKSENYQKSLILYKKAMDTTTRIMEAESEEKGNSPKQNEKPGADEPKAPEGADRLFTSLARNYIILANYDKALELYEPFTSDNSENGDSGAAASEIEAFYGLADIEIIRGQFAAAQGHLEKAQKLTRKISPETLDALEADRRLGSLTKQRGQQKQALNILSQCLKEATVYGSQGKAITASILNDLAEISLQSPDYKEAAKQAERALTLNKEVFGNESMEAAQSMLILANTMPDDPQAAEQLRLKVMAIQTKALGTFNNPTVAYTMLALARGSEAPFSKLESLCQAARHCVDGILDETTPFYADYLARLTCAYEYQLKTKPTIETAVQTIKLITKLYGADNIQIASSLQSQARALYLAATFDGSKITPKGNAQLTEADTLIDQAIAIAAKQRGDDCYRAACCRSVKASIKKAQKDYRQAEITQKKALTTFERLDGPNSKELFGNRKILFDILIAQGNFDSAKVLLAKMLALKIDENGYDSREVALLIRDALRLEGQVELQKNPPTATTSLRDRRQISDASARVLQILQGYSSETGGTSSAMNAIENALLTEGNPGKFSRSVKQLSTMIADSERKFGSESPILCTCLVSLGDLYRDANMYQEAEPIYQRALAMAENGLGADHPVLIKILKPYSLLLEHSNRKEEAQKMAARYKMLELQNGGPPKETALDGASTQDRAGRPN